jgi:Tol biopolymer transport system component
MTLPTVTDRAIEMMLRERGGMMVPSGLENAIVVAVRAESARAGASWRRWLARPALRPAVTFALLALLLAALLAAISVAGQNGIPAPAPVPSPASSASPATSAGGDGLILFSRQFSIDEGSTVTHCSTFYTIRPDGSDERQLPVDCMAYGNASWGPTGDTFVFDLHSLSSSVTQIDEASADGGNLSELLTVPGVMPTFSHDGSQIAYAGSSGGIVIAAADGTQPHQLTSTSDPSNNGDLWPHFSPDGSRLAFTRVTNGSDTVQGTSEVWMVNTDGTDLHQLTGALPESDYAGWSSDGSRLLLTGRQTATGDMGLWTINADGTGLTPIVTSNVGSAEWGEWSPDGSRIVFNNFHSGVNSLRVMNADGSGVTTLLSNSVGNSGGYGLPDWGISKTLQPEAP